LSLYTPRLAQSLAGDGQSGLGCLGNGAAGGVGLTLGALLAGITASWGGWRAALAVHLPFAIAAFVIARRGLHDSPSGPASSPFDWPGALLSCIGITAAMVFGVTGAELGWGSPPMLITLAVASVCGAAFILVEVRHPAPLVGLDVFRNRRFLLACTLCLLFTIVWVALFIYVPLHLQMLQARSALDAGMTMLGLMVPGLVMPLFSSRMAVRWRMSFVLCGGFILMAAGLLALLAGWSGNHIRTLDMRAMEMLGLVACGAGVGTLYGLVDYLALTALPPHRSGVASGAFNLVRLAGDALGAIIPGAILLQTVQDALAPHIPGEAPRAVTGAIAAGHFTAVERLDVQPAALSHLSQVAELAFAHGMSCALGVLCALATVGAVAGLAGSDRLPRPSDPPRPRHGA